MDVKLALSPVDGWKKFDSWTDCWSAFTWHYAGHSTDGGHKKHVVCDRRILLVGPRPDLLLTAAHIRAVRTC